MAKFTEVLARARKEKRIKLRDLSQTVGLSMSYLSEIENGKKQPPDEQILYKLAKALNIEGVTLVSLAREEKKKQIKLDSTLKRFLQNRGDLGFALCRAAENASDEELAKIIKKLEKRER